MGTLNAICRQRKKGELPFVFLIKTISTLIEGFVSISTSLKKMFVTYRKIHVFLSKIHVFLSKMQSSS